MDIENGAPSWLDLEIKADRLLKSRMIDGLIGGASAYILQSTFGNDSAHLIFRRISCVRQACIFAEKEATTLISKRFSEMNIQDVIEDFLAAATGLAIIITSSMLAGAGIGGGVGTLAGGIGAIPGATAGALIGAQVSSWVLALLGLSSIADFFIENLGPVVDGYVRGISIAWNGPREQINDLFDDRTYETMAARQGAWEIARSHEALVILLLSAIFEYLTRRRGEIKVLADAMQRSRRGTRIAQWMVQYEDALRRRTDLWNRSEKNPSSSETGTKLISSPEKNSTTLHNKRASMPLFEVDCFKSGKLPHSKIDEFKRQLKGQENGLNRLTVREYLENIVNPLKRDPDVARRARKELEMSLQRRFQSDFLHLDPLEAEIAAIKKAKETMKDLAALHNPDLVAGGKDVIDDFGDRQVNSTIGPQWRSRIDKLKSAAEQVPSAERERTFINVRLHKC